MTETFTLYRFFDAEDALLYVGLTVNPGRRMENHRNDKSWWGDVARISMEQHSSIAELRAAERTAIQTEKPRHNIRMNGAGTPPKLQPAVVAEAKPAGLMGRWFHSYRPLEPDEDTRFLTLDGRGNTRQWQGQIIDRDGDIYIAQLYSWWDGCPTNEVVVDAEDMRFWRFYPSNEAMHVALGCTEDFGPKKGGVCGAPVTHRIFSGHLGPIYRCWRCIEFYNGKAEEL